ncbi:MAG: type II secretion system protein [Armatimonadota bacterium]
MSRKSGFTLIELLVVIAIIAILAAILFPVFAGAKARAHQTMCTDNMKQLHSALMLYRNDYNGRMPSLGKYCYPNMNDWCGSPYWGYPVSLQRGSLWKYAKTAGIYLCPADKGISADALAANVTLEQKKNFALSYTINMELSASFPGVTASHPGDPETSPCRSLSRLLMLMHESRKSINDGLFRPLWDQIGYAHYDGTTVCYFDGHAKWMSKKSLEKEKADGYWKTEPSKGYN